MMSLGYLDFNTQSETESTHRFPPTKRNRKYTSIPTNMKAKSKVRTPFYN